jgi:hypothetical protein
MLKEDFERWWQDKLVNSVQFDTRKTWGENDLYVWWTGVKSDASHVTFQGMSDQWHHVETACRNFIGAKAIR